MKARFSFLVAMFALASGLRAQPTAITYQGRLGENGGAASGIYDLRFEIHDSLSGGNAVSGAHTNLATMVSNGLFTVLLDFDAGVFDGAERWLEIGVRTNGGSIFATLAPRQKITATPYAITAGNLTGVVSNTSVAGTYSNTVAFNNPSNQFTGAFTGNGGGLSNVNAQTLGGLGSASFWKTTGNSGTAPGVNFLGTTDNQPLVLGVGGQEAMRYEPTAETPNVVGGWISNYVQPGLMGVTIGGGGSIFPFNGQPQPNVVTSNGYYATIAGGYNNTVRGFGGAVVGGSVNAVVGNFGVIGGGQFHTIDLDAVYSVIGGGFGNIIETNAQGAFIGGGGANVIRHDTFVSSIGGGYGNTNGAGSGFIGGGTYNRIEPNNVAPAIVGGNGNVIRENVSWGFIGAGNVNEIQSGSGFSVIAGGSQNVIQTNAGFSVIGGGLLHSIEPFADQSVIAGGNANHIYSGARESFIGGGFANAIQTNAGISFIGGGAGNVIASNSPFSTIAGGRDHLIQSDAANAMIGGGQANLTASGSTVIGGGVNNRILAISAWATIAGGAGNSISNEAIYSSIGGGGGNHIGNRADRGFIGGGSRNTIRPFAFHGTIAGGSENAVLFNSQFGTIAGGRSNVVASFGFVGGGDANTNSGFVSTIAGGFHNYIGSLSDYSMIGGGGDNRIVGSQLRPVFGTISGGQFNSIQTNATFSAIGGGAGNQVEINAQYATVPGGRENSAGGDYSFAAGRRAKANHQGAFVWADAFDTNFATTASNQFLIRARGGVGINTTNPTAALEVVGTIKAAGFVDNGSGFTGSFIGNGGSLSNVNAATLGGTASSNYWRLGGNFLSSAPLVLGTIDPVPLTVIAGNRRALRLETASRAAFPGVLIAPNLAGGSEANVISNGVLGGTIAGGGQINQISGFPLPFPNTVSDDFGTLGGGVNNTVGNTNADFADARGATVAGGENNLAGASHAALGGGLNNSIGANAVASVVGGGMQNIILENSLFSTIAGGNNNFINVSAVAATVSGGQGNAVHENAIASLVAGGSGNIIGRESASSAISGGSGNEIDIDADATTIGGGEFNRIGNLAQWSSIDGGYGNFVQSSSRYGTIGGGRENIIGFGAATATVAGGSNNFAGAAGATVGGGRVNISQGLAATVPGGQNNDAIGDYSFAAGRRAKANHAGTFVWADAQDLDFGSTGSNQFSVRASGGVRLSADTPNLSFDGPNTSITFPPVVGASAPMIHLFSTGTGNSPRMVLAHSPNFPDWGLRYDDSPDKFHFLASGIPVMTVDLGNQRVGIGNASPVSALDVNGEARATIFTPTSDRAAKENLQPVRPEEVLAKLAALPIARWNFKSLPGAEHIGPMAQDFQAAFHVGSDDKHIATVDADGVALAAIQGLNRKLEAALVEKEARIEKLEAAVVRLERMFHSANQARAKELPW
jgi:trimeric autotransporter adhesin